MEPTTTGLVVGVSTAVSSLVGMVVSLLLRAHLARRKREREERDRRRADEREREHDTLRLLRQVQEQLRENEVECQRMMEDRRREMVENQEALRRLRHESERVQEELEDHVRARQRELAGEPARIALDEHVIRMALARAYSHPDNSGKVLDPQLIAVMAAEIRRELEVREADPPPPLTRPPDRRTESRLLNDTLLSHLRSIASDRPDDAFRSLEEFLRHFDREDERKGQPEYLAYTDGCPLYDRDFELANECGVDVRFVLAVRFLMVKYMDPSPRVRPPARLAPVTEGERNLEV